MIQTRAQHRRRLAAVLGRAQHDDNISQLGFIHRRLVRNPLRDVDHLGSQRD
jgi:hypothetical protein